MQLQTHDNTQRSTTRAGPEEDRSSPANEKAGVPPGVPPKEKPVLVGGALLAGVPKPKAGAEEAPPVRNKHAMGLEVSRHKGFNPRIMSGCQSAGSVL
jgi:hypothetical protein